MITAVVLTGCKKNETPQADLATGEVQFNITNIMDDGSRVEIPNIPDCDLTATPLYATVTITSDIEGNNEIDGSPFTMAISDIGDLMTDVLKLVPGTYYVTQFDVFGADGDDEGDEDDLIWRAPAANSFYNSFMNIPLNREFAVVAYEKIGYEVEVLCYDETVADEFGFVWFDIDKVVLRDICLFGDICLTQFPDVDNWGVGGYSGEFDMPALFQVELYRNDVLLAYYSNYQPTEEGFEPDPDQLGALCIQYPDALEIDGEEFDLVLSVIQPDGNGGFAPHEWYTFEWQDDAELDPDLNFGDDNVIDFYIGHCYNPATPPDYAWPEQGPSAPVVEPGWNSEATTVAGARWRNFLMDGNGWEMAVGVPSAIGSYDPGWANLDFTYAADYYFMPETTPNVFIYVYDAVTGDQTVACNVNGGGFSATQNNGNLGAINYMQINVVGRNGQTVHLNNVVLTVGSDSFPLGDFSAGGWLDWQINNFDLSGGFTITGDAFFEGQAAGEENSKINIVVGTL